MTHWGWYWKIKKKHNPKALCSWFSEIDSFEMFKNKEGLEWVRRSQDRVLLEIPRYKFKAMLEENDDIRVVFEQGTYIIPVESKPCNFGGFYRFFHCPQCNSRMRKLYCLQGRYLCRKCAKLSYYSQQLRPLKRTRYMQYKATDYLKNRAGSLEQKPPRMRQHTFQKLRRKYLLYDQRGFNEGVRELREWYGAKIERFVEGYFPPSTLCDIFDFDDERP